MSEVDDYVFQVFGAIREEAERSGAESSGEEASNIILPLLIQVDNLGWSSEEMPDCTELCRIGNIIACTGSIRTVRALQDDPSVISIEASRRATRLECDYSIPFVKADRVHQNPAGPE